MRADGYSERTRQARVQAVRIIAAAAGVEPHQLRPEHVRDYLLAHELSAWSRRTYRNHLRAWAKWTGGPDPTAGIRWPSAPRAVPNPLSESALEALLEYLQGVDHRYYTWALLGAFAGLRANETARYSSKDRDGDTLRVRGKGGRIDVLPVAPILGQALAVYDRCNGRAWPDTNGRRVSERVAYHAGRIGIPMRYHQLRHRFGTAVYAATHDLLLTQRLMRHVSPQTTAGYAAVADARTNRVVASLPGADGPPDVERMIS